MDMRLVNPFITSAGDIISQMTGIAISAKGEPYNESGDINSFGVASVINFSGTSGKVKGRFVLDISPELAFQMAYNLLGEPCSDMKDRMFLASISEINNIIAGDANTHLNNAFSLGLRLAPPIVFTGRNIIVATSRMNSLSLDCSTDFGLLKYNIGFQGGVD